VIFVSLKFFSLLCRGRKELQLKTDINDEKFDFLDVNLKESIFVTEEADRRYDEVIL